MLTDFLVPFAAVGLAEMIDKSQITLLTLSSHYRKHGMLFLGVVAAFIAAQALAVVAGDLVTRLIPVLVQKILISGLLFGFGMVFLFKDEEEEVKLRDSNPFLTGFSLIFLAEMGDKTQIVTIIFAAQYNPWAVFFSTTLVLVLISAVSLFVGKYIRKYMRAKTLHTIAGIVFLALAVAEWLY